MLAAALWMPVCRFFYAPAMILFAYPVALHAHALLCVRGAWRRAWYAVPLLAGGAALWWLSLSIVVAAANHWEWRFINPIGAYGANVWTQTGEAQVSSLSEAVRLRARSVATNVQRVATTMASRTGFSHWYERSDETRHPTLVNVGFLVMAVLGLCYLLGQAYERRALALLLWVGIGILPALLSEDPADRRMAAMFPALDVVAGVFVGAVIRLVRRCAGRQVEWLTSAVLAVTLVAVMWTSLASHLLLRMAPLTVEEAFAFTRPLFRESDVIVHNLDRTVGWLLAFGNLDDFLARPPCYQAMPNGEWLATAVPPRCDFTDEVFRFTLAPPRIAALRALPPGDRISFLLDDRPITRSHVDGLRGVYPHAEYRELHTANDEFRLVSLTITRAEAATLRAPVLRLGPDQPAAAQLASRLLAGVTLAAVARAGCGGRRRRWWAADRATRVVSLRGGPGVHVGTADGR